MPRLVILATALALIAPALAGENVDGFTRHYARLAGALIALIVLLIGLGYLLRKAVASPPPGPAAQSEPSVQSSPQNPSAAAIPSVPSPSSPPTVPSARTAREAVFVIRATLIIAILAALLSATFDEPLSWRSGVGLVVILALGYALFRNLRTSR